MKNKTYLISSFYILTVMYLVHFMLNMKMLDFLTLYSKIGVYFAYGILLTYGFLYSVKNVDFFKKIDGLVKQNSGIILIVVVLLSHLLALYDPIDKVIRSISSIMNLNTYLISFILGLSIFILGIVLLKKYDKKMIFIPMGMLFIYGFYYFLTWDSMAQQRNVFVKTYSIALEKNVVLNECDENILCGKIPYKDLRDLNPKESVNKKEESDKKINRFLDDYMNKIEKSKENIVSFSYLDNLTTFLDEEYKPISVYNKKEEIIMLDYKSFDRIQENGLRFYTRLTGTASFLWIVFLHLLMGFHFIIKNVIKKRGVKNEVQ